MAKKDATKTPVDRAALLDLMDDSVVVLDRDCRITFCNETYALFIGKDARDIIGKKIEAFAPNEDVLLLRQVVEEIFSGSTRRVSFQSQRAKPDGTFIDVDVACKAIKTDGKVSGLLVVSRNISERENIRRNLEKQKERYQRLINNMSEFLFVVDADEKIIFCNEAYAGVYNKKPEELTGQSCLEKIHPEDVLKVRDHFKRILEGERDLSSIIIRIVDVSRGMRLIETAGRAIKFRGEKNAVEFIARDVTEREKARLRLEQVNKELEERQQQLMRDIGLASKIHRSLLPRPIKNSRIIADIKHIPLLGLGGDYASVQLFMQRYLAAAIFDVTGHGLAASLLASRVHSEIYRLVRNNYSPSRILKSINSFVYNNFPDMGLFLTLFTARINFLTGSVRYSGGGHPPAILKRAGKRRAELLRSESPLAGVIEADDFEESEAKIRMGKGDVLVLYTDGISDILGGENNTNGFREFAELISDIDFSAVDENLSEHIFSFVKPHIRKPVLDDMTVFAVKLR